MTICILIGDIEHLEDLSVIGYYLGGVDVELEEVVDLGEDLVGLGRVIGD